MTRAFLLALFLLAHSAFALDLIYRPVKKDYADSLPDVVPIFKKTLAFKIPKTLHLPNQKSFTSHGNVCAQSQTACSLSNGKLACCGFDNGICCSDHLSCCPNGYQCNIKDSRCEPNNYNITLSSVVCPDGQSQCPSGSSCCKLKTGQYGCCPLEKATCCSDGVHCCPNGYSCDVATGACSKKNSIVPLTKTESKSKSVVCPDGQSQCPSGSTCCKLKTGQYGCCPLEKATCCSDGVHCCPNGYSCDVATEACSKKNSIMPLTKTKIESNSVVCPDGQSQCPSGSTCCKLKTGQYGCCPLEKATCCSDGVHCCPNGYSCDVATGACSKKNSIMPLVKTESKSKSVVCPDGQSQCPSGSTCCKLKTGQYGCCPLEKATCCSDGVHCCPNGYSCDVATGACSKKNSIVPLMKTESKSKSVVCPDGQSQCPSGSTCCKLKTGQYGCCPLEKATCCSDGVHCCPNGYSCDVATGACSKKNSVMPFVKTELKSKSVVCPDGQSQCPSGSTCCKLKTGQYGCCPLEKATCCSDGVHCCPNGYSCDVATGACSKKGKTQNSASQVSKCCKLPFGGMLCCKNGLVCDNNSLTCIPIKSELAQLRTTNPLSVDELQRAGSVVRMQILSVGKRCTTNANDRCRIDDTCCNSALGTSRCCAMRDAVCCPGGESCCPKGFTCNAGAGTCVPAA